MSTKAQVLQEAMKTIEKQFGKWAIMKMGESTSIGMVNTFHSGSYVLDLILGWGYPEGRVIEIYGPESSGKTTIALHAIAEVQKRWEIAAFIDAEHALDPQYAKKLGVNVSELLLSQPDFGEQALQIAEELAKTGAVKLIVIDSVSALVPRAEVEGSMWDTQIGLQARMMSQGLRKLTSILAKTGTTCIFINQIRMKIGVMFGNPETTSGWQALKFFASQRLEIRRGDKVTEDKEQVGYIAKIKTVKNKIFAPFKTVELPVLWGSGYDAGSDILEAANVLKLIERAGAFYTIGDQKVQGKEKLLEYLQSDDKVRTDLEKNIQSKIKEMRLGKQVLDEDVLDSMSETSEVINEFDDSSDNE
jgi:recombination protein RecA